MSNKIQVRNLAFQFIKKIFQLVGKDEIYSSIETLPKGHKFKIKQFWESPSTLDLDSLEQIYDYYSADVLDDNGGEFTEEELFESFGDDYFGSNLIISSLNHETDPILRLILMKALAKAEMFHYAKGNIYIKKYNCDVFVQIPYDNDSQLLVREIYPLDVKVSYSKEGKYLFGDNAQKAMRCFNHLKKLAKRAGLKLPIAAYDNGNLSDLRENIKESGSDYIEFANNFTFYKDAPSYIGKTKA